MAMKLLSAARFAVIWLCAASAAAATDYRDRNNWVICDDGKDGAPFDVFYVYPTLSFAAFRGGMPWRDDPKLRHSIERFVRSQTRLLAPGARIYAPFVRQLGYPQVAAVIGSGKHWRRAVELNAGAEDTTAAFRHYLRRFNRGRPYILFGHSQGAMDLYLMMLGTPELSLRGGFVAAYLIGLPRLGAADIASDMAERGIRPAAKADDLGVIVGWNSQLPWADVPFFSGRGTYCINPLNWRTDGVPADRSGHRGAVVYDRTVGRYRMVGNFCGARIDISRGALVLDIPDRRGRRGILDHGITHMDDVWFFVVNIRDNIELRVKKWSVGHRSMPRRTRPDAGPRRDSSRRYARTP